MNILTTLLIGACVHALVGAGVFFAKEEPYKVQIFVATILKGPVGSVADRLFIAGESFTRCVDRRGLWPALRFGFWHYCVFSQGGGF